MKTNRTTQKRKTARKKVKNSKAISLQELEGTPYAGIPHNTKWNFGKAAWNESKRNAKAWDFTFETIAIKPFEADLTVPIGTELHSYILAHQKIIKVRKNTYKVKLEGVKIKLAHKIAGENWSSTKTARNNQIASILNTMVAHTQLEHGRAPSDTKKVPHKKVDE